MKKLIPFLLIAIIMPLASQASIKLTKKKAFYVDESKAWKKLYTKSDSCTPVIRWYDFREGDQTLVYDFALHYSLKLKSGQPPMRGEQIILAESLKTNAIKIVQALKPDTKYLWSIRLKNQEDKVTNWFTHGATRSTVWDIIGGTGGSTYTNIWFGIKTPKECQNEAH